MWINNSRVTAISSRASSPRAVRARLRLLHRFEAGRGQALRLLTANVRIVLGEPRPRAARIARACLDGNDQFYALNDWLARQNDGVILKHINQIEFPDEDAFRRVTRSLDRPLILLAAHMGNYLPALMRLTRALPLGLPLTVVKREAPNSRDRLIEIMRDQRPIEIARTADQAGRHALRALRRQHVVILMGDVPPAFLSPAQTERTNDDSSAGCWRAPFLSSDGQLLRGPALLATRTNALIVPVATAEGRVTCAPSIDAAQWPPAERSRAVHDRIARTLDRWVRNQPDDWLLWAHVRGYVRGFGSGPQNQS